VRGGRGTAVPILNFSAQREVGGQHQAPEPHTPAKDPIPIDKLINPNNKSTLTLHVHVFTAECEMSGAANLSPDVREHDFKENMIFSSLL